MTLLALVAAPLLALTQSRVVAADTTSVSGCVTAAGSAVPLADVRIDASRSRASAASDALGRFTIAVDARDTVRLRRLGYRQRLVPAHELAARKVCVTLSPITARLPRVVVRDSSAGGASAGRIVATRTVESLRAAGAGTVADAVALLPFVSSRAARGDVALSMRGSRSEQVVVTLDGVPLNDPSTGRADLAGLPLAFLGAVSAVPGSDVAAYGSGASGGVLALNSGGPSGVGVTVGSYGALRVDGAARVPMGAARVRVGGSLARSRNDFPFVNDMGCTGCDSVERRVNADERSASAVLSATLPAAQLLVLATESEQGMAGPENVRVYDADRGRERRLVARGAAGWRGFVGQGSVRLFRLDYHDARRPTQDSDARAVAGDVDVARAVADIALRGGVGFDRGSVRGGTGVLEIPLRPRGFASATLTRASQRATATLAARVDAVRTYGTRATASAAVEGRGKVAPFVRLSQAFRVPTLYDSYFASPQRVLVRELKPEYVVLDAEAGARTHVGRVSAAASAFARVTDDAIVWFPGNFSWSPTNVGRERVVGAEGQASFDAAWLGFDAWAGAYLPRLRAGSATVPTPYVPYASGGATATAHLGRASLVATLRAMGRRPYLNAPASRDYELPGVALVGVHASYRCTLLRSSAAFTAGVDDLGDVRWEPVRSYPTAGRTWSAGLTLQP